MIQRMGIALVVLVVAACQPILPPQSQREALALAETSFTNIVSQFQIECDVVRTLSIETCSVARAIVTQGSLALDAAHADLEDGSADFDLLRVHTAIRELRVMLATQEIDR